MRPTLARDGWWSSWARQGRPSNGRARLPHLALALLCIFVPCLCINQPAATTEDFLEAVRRAEALAASQPPTRGRSSTPSKAVMVTPGAAGARVRPRAQTLHPTVIHVSVVLIGPSRGTEGIDRAGAPRQQGPATITISTTGTAEPAVVVDLRDTPRGLLLLPAGVELTLQRLTLSGFGSTPGAAGQGLSEDGVRLQGHIGAAATDGIAALVSGWLLHSASRGKLVLNDVMIELDPSVCAGGRNGGEQLQVRQPYSSADVRPAGEQERNTASAFGSEASAGVRHRHLRGAARGSSAIGSEHHQQHHQQHHQHHQQRGQALQKEALLQQRGHVAGYEDFVDIARHPSEVGLGREARPVLDSQTVVSEGALLVVHATRVRCGTVGDEGATGATGATGAAAAAAGSHAMEAKAPAAAEAATAAATAAADVTGATVVKVVEGRRRLLAAVNGRWHDQPGPEVTHGSDLTHPLTSGFMQVAMVAVAAVALGGVVWLRRLLSCACLAPSGALLPDSNRAQNGSRSMHKTASGTMARTSQNHTLSALSRFSEALRKGDDPSVRDGSRHGSMLLRAGGGDTSVRGGNCHQLVTPPELPPLIKDLAELKPAGGGRLATTLQGIWQQQHRVVVKVLSHSENCSFMLEQVGEVWSRLTHANVVTCCSAETFPVTALASRPDLAELVPKASSAGATLQTWLVLERCENGSLAAMLAQRYQQHLAARKAAAAASGGGGGGGGDGSGARDPGTRQIGRRLRRFSRGRPKASTEPRDGASSATATATAMAVTSAVTSATAVSEQLGASRSSSCVTAEDPPPPPSPSGAAPPPSALAPPPALASPPQLALPPGSASAVASPTAAASPRGLASPTAAAPLWQRAASSANEPAFAASGAAGGDDGAAVAAATGPASSGGEGTVHPQPGLLPLAEVLSIAHDVASGLAYLHSLDLCHGDLRAENILIQTVVLPSTARAAGSLEVSGGGGGADAAGDGPAPVDVVGLPYTADGRAGAGGAVEVAAVTPAQAPSGVLGGSCHPVHEGLAMMYGSNSCRSDGTDASGGVPVLTGAAAGNAVTHQRSTLSNMSSYGGTTNASCAGMQDSSAHAWSTSLRHSNGFMTGSTFASTALHSLAAAGGAGGGGTGGGVGPGVRGFEQPGTSVDDRLGPGSMPSQGLASTLGHSYFSPSGRPAGQPYGLAGLRASIGPGASGANGTAARYGGGLTAAVGGAAGDGAAGAAADDAGLSNAVLTASAVAALSRAIGVSGTGASQPQPPRTAATAGGASTAAGGGGGGAAAAAAAASGFSRRQSNGSLSAANTNSGNDISMSKALSALTAWPESPHEGRHSVGQGPHGATAGSSNATAGGLATVSSSHGGLGGLAVALSRSGSSAVGGAGGPSPVRKPPVVIGGLKSALAASESSRLSAASPPHRVATNVLSPPPPPPPPPQALSNGAPEQSPFASPQFQAQASGDSSSAAAAAAAAAASAARLAAPLVSSQLPSESCDSPQGGTPPLIPPRLAAVQVDVRTASSSGPPSPGGAAATAAAAGTDGSDGPNTCPSTPTGAATASAAAAASPASPGAAAAAAAGRSRTVVGVGVTCNIASHQGRRCSAPSMVALPVIRRVAKLTDPWLSLACVPAECAGGPWSPQAAEAVGATSGADVAHLPPELLLSGRLHPSSDVYSLGILMWRMLSATGEAPYGKLRPAEVAYKVVACGMRPAFSPAIPEPLRRLVEDCWMTDPAARPTVDQVLKRLSELQAIASSLQGQWKDRHGLFGAVSTMPISAVAVLPLSGEENDIAARWAEAAGIKLLRGSMSFGGSAAAAAAAAVAAAMSSRGGGGDLSAQTSFVCRSSRNASGVLNAIPSYTSTGGAPKGSAGHLYQQPPPPTPPAGQISNHVHPLAQFTTVNNTTGGITLEMSNHSNAFESGNHQRSSQSNHRPASPFTGHLPVQPYRRGGGDGSGGVPDAL